MDRNIVGQTIKVTLEFEVDKVEFAKEGITISGWVKKEDGTKSFCILPYIESTIEKEISTW